MRVADAARSGMWLLFVPVTAATACILGLLLFVVVLSFCRMDNGSIAGTVGWANYGALLGDPGFWRACENTAVFATIALFVSGMLGVPLAWLAERTDMPGRSLLWTAMIGSLILPGFLTAMGWLFLAHPRIGLINVALMQTFHLTSAPFPVNTVVGMGIIQGIVLASLTFVLVAPSLRTMDPSLEEAAAMSGAPIATVLRCITLPLLLPGLSAAAIYIAIVALGSFDIPAVIGFSNRIYTFSTYMYTKAYPTGGFPDYTTIAAGGTILIVLALVLSGAYSTVLARARRFQVVTGKGYRPGLARLGRWRIPALLFVGGYLFIALVLPFIVTFLSALMPFAQPISLGTLQTLSFTNFQNVPWDMVAGGALRTLEIVVVVPFVVLATSLAFSWVVLRTRIRGRFLLDAVAFLPHAVPGVLFGIGASLTALFVLQKFVPVYGTTVLLMAVYWIAWISFGTRIVNSSLIQIHTELLEAGQVSGASFATVIRQIVAPLLRPAMFGVWIFVALLAMRELTLAAFVTTPSNLTLPMVAWTLWSNGSLTQAAAVAVIIVLAISPLLVLYFTLGRRTEMPYQ
jgi:iron(III) transport system permease protein